MAILPRVDISVRTPDLGLGGAQVDAGLGGGSGLDLDIAVGNLTAKVGLAGILASDSPVERLLHGPDALARFRTAPAADPSPIATKGMTLRAGDIYAEVATRHDIGGTRTPDATLRTDSAVRADAPGLTVRVAAGADMRAVPAVRDLAEAAALPQRINGPGGTIAAGRGIEVGVGARIGAAAGDNGLHLALGQAIAGSPATVTVVVPTPVQPAGGRDAPAPAGVAPSPVAATTTRVLSLDGLVNILGRAGTPVIAPQDAPAGAILVYERADGTQALELRTAAGFAGLGAASATPLTGAPGVRSGEGYMLVGVLVPARGGPVGPSPFTVAAAVVTPAGAGDADEAGTTVRSAEAPAAVRAEAAAASPAAEAKPAASDRTTGVQPAYANAIATSDLGGQVVRPADGSAIPAGVVVAQEDARPSFGEHSSDPATDRPYVHALWYDIMALRFAEAGVDLLGRSTVLRDVVWATAIEHGPFASADAGDVLSRVARALDLPGASDAAIIAALFAERTRRDDGVLVHFPEVLPFDRDRVVARLNDEAQIAIGRLAP